MIINRILLISLSFLLTFAALKAQQQVHFTHYSLVPLTVNPAQTGLFEGSYRIGGLFRSQWQVASAVSGFQTPSFFVDVPISGFRKQDWIGLGLNVTRDNAGEAALVNTLLGLNAAYHVGLDKKLTRVLSFGLQGGFVQRGIDKTKLSFEDQIRSGGGVSSDVRNINDNNKSYMDFNFGINLRSQVNKKTLMNIGISADHLTSPQYNLLSQPTANVPLRFNIYGNVERQLTEKLSLTPSVLVSSSAGTLNLMVQAMGGLKIDPKKSMILRGGLGYRLGDAAQVLLGADFGDFRVGAAYDFTLSSLRGGRVRDAFELGFGYIGKIYKTVKPPTVILCPRY